MLPLLLPYQQRFVKKMLEHALRYDHVLYCIDNETSGEEEWGRYWAQFVKQEAQRALQLISHKGAHRRTAMADKQSSRRLFRTEGAGKCVITLAPVAGLSRGRR